MKRIALVTGASSGFGTYVARAFSKAGFDVVITGRNGERLDEVHKEIISKSGTSIKVVADVLTPEGQAAIKNIFSTQAVDVLVNCASIHLELVQGKPLVDIEAISKTLLTNTASTIALCTDAYEQMAVRGSGTIINVNSAAGLKGNYGEAVYTASKFGLRGYSEAVKDTWLKRGVKMIDVYSGAIATGMSVSRADVKVLMDPVELADFIVSLCATNTFYVRDVSVQRTRQM